ncbi:DsbA family protein [Neobacillus ginsengisoli]|uniref:Protein-disulfide isomerase n=1 Tax=Neobacillus ginsengisoli TaxID=904295 RepID=A0ABT9XTS6_9BACI|nr:DsbA family protein [Neobacillus ginsengisoli]MDQ0198751.1 protein-disulfide isomerase [Neobacillus ginsengisoli]
MANSNKKTKKESQSSSKFTFWVIGLIAAFVLGFIFLGNHTKTVQKASTATIDYSAQPYLGKKSAPVSIIEFGDYKCPNCKNFAANVVPLIQKDVVDTGKAKLYFFNDPFINVDSTRAAKFAEGVYHELGSDTFWKFHETLYKKQPDDSNAEKTDIYDEKFLVATLKEAAPTADVNKVLEYFHANKADAAVNKDLGYAAKLGVTGTPTIFVDGKPFTGKTMDDLISMVDKAAKGK